jgi:hypothetical protein
VTLAAGPNPHGRPWQLIAGVEGRTLDVLRLPGRDGGEVQLHACRLAAPLASTGAVRQFQFVPGPRALRLDVVLAPAAGDGTVERIRAALVAELEAAGAAALDVDVAPVGAIARRPGPGAKRTVVEHAPG